MDDAVSPLAGARRREGLLLTAYALLFVIGVWTVVASELDAQDPAQVHPDNVGQTTENRAPPGK
jgi:hypothetical protein